ncbi:dihydrolipoyl dehydrogenase [Halolactibacillus alkaliphilus]|uniref:Dihydrolipoyl dehydrogenase n=1 Tax=Halolactibacillus alkaliphilus TaxID=442899 RepID=A0A511X2N9_9BACI|nr:dihydrolipoyl dehydrogenase [Halolactibacillus alkaliphilus]GEN57220.1 dihydrolipoyl dehydrogenase [Halolactibacillus alkaliphilus]GGN68743.1 dihydrolipoyl dehydrogenase [Halolactibacillus alkaliphilus]SFO72936.1 dihydrolipoamide dehydrogenase [Halolactibacillus alkaliphilus]
MSKNYDLVILGGGMGGYISAIRARQLGKTVAIVEKDRLGGTCLHKGCIPTKALLKSAEVFQTVKKCGLFGVKVKDLAFNYLEAFQRKNTVVDKLYQGVNQLMKKHRVDMYYGVARLLGPSIFSPLAGAVSVETTEETETLIGKQVLIATGAKPRSLESLPFDHQRILSSDSILALEELPTSLTIVGGGVIGVEWASMMLDFGVQVTLVEQQKHLLPGFEPDVQKEILTQLKKRGLKVYVNTTVMGSRVRDDEDLIELTLANEPTPIITSHVLVSAGRIAETDQLGLNNTQIETDDYGFIKVNENFQTKEAHIYAVGDVIGGKQLAHVASFEGKAAVNHMFDQPIDLTPLQFIPSCVYSTPEVATVGLTESEAKALFTHVKTAKYPFQAIGKAIVNDACDGFVKVVINDDTRDVLGVSIIGDKATELISEVGLGMVLNASIEEFGETIHPHPSMSEVIEEVSLLAIDRPVHV